MNYKWFIVSSNKKKFLYSIDLKLNFSQMRLRRNAIMRNSYY